MKTMNKFLTLALAGLLVLATSFDADAARRLGGGRSIGQQSSNVTQREAARSPAAPAQNTTQKAAQPAPTPAAPAPAAAPKRPWGAMLGGLAAGLGLAWLAHSLGMGEGFGQVLLFALLAMVVVAVISALLRNRRPASSGGDLALQGMGAAGPVTPATPRGYSPDKVGNDASARPWETDDSSYSPAGGSIIGSALAGPQNWGIPAGFDTSGFLDAAKRNFTTLQDAWDRGDIPTLRSMMTDTMLGEIRSQLAEREKGAPGQPNKTEVLSLDAQLLGIEELDDAYMASVEFNGMIREEPSAGFSPFREVWNMTKPRDGRSGWLVAGLQALQ